MFRQLSWQNRKQFETK